MNTPIELSLIIIVFILGIYLIYKSINRTKIIDYTNRCEPINKKDKTADFLAHVDGGKDSICYLIYDADNELLGCSDNPTVKNMGKWPNLFKKPFTYYKVTNKQYAYMKRNIINYPIQ